MINKRPGATRAAGEAPVFAGGREQWLTEAHRRAAWEREGRGMRRRAEMTRGGSDGGWLFVLVGYWWLADRLISIIYSIMFNPRPAGGA